MGVVWISQVTPNLYGTLVANTAAGIAGGTGVMPGGTFVRFIFSLSTIYATLMKEDRTTLLDFRFI